MTNYVDVTELSGDEVSQEQVERLCHRYYWAGGYCRDKDVLEAGCGAGQGLGYIAGLARSVIGEAFARYWHQLWPRLECLRYTEP